MSVASTEANVSPSPMRQNRANGRFQCGKPVGRARLHDDSTARWYLELAKALVAAKAKACSRVTIGTNTLRSSWQSAARLLQMARGADQPRSAGAEQGEEERPRKPPASSNMHTTTPFTACLAFVLHHGGVTSLQLKKRAP